MQPTQRFLAELSAPELSQLAQPEKREQHLFLELRFERRCDANPSLGSGADETVDLGQIRQIEQFKETVEGEWCATGLAPGIDDRTDFARADDAKPALLPQPFHLRSVGGGFLGNHDRRRTLFKAEQPRESFHHAVRATDDVVTEFVIGFAQPPGQADAAGYAIEFSNEKMIVVEDDIGPDHARDLAFEPPQTRGLDQLPRFAGIEGIGDPLGQGAAATVTDHDVARAVEGQQIITQLCQGADQLRGERERLRGGAPGRAGKQTAAG